MQNIKIKALNIVLFCIVTCIANAEEGSICVSTVETHLKYNSDDMGSRGRSTNYELQIGVGLVCPY